LGNVLPALAFRDAAAAAESAKLNEEHMRAEKARPLTQ
jgi:hypothetical protein